MPKRTDIKKIMIIGGGPVTIGQAGQSDYAATAASHVLRGMGYEIVVIDPNPDAALTDIDVADHSYIEPLTSQWVGRVIEKENPDALFSAVGGQSALNLSMLLNKEGVLARYGVELIGSDERAIARCEDRKLFKETMERAAICVPASHIAKSIDEGLQIISDLKFPVAVRPSYTSAGSGSAIAYNREEYMHMLSCALEASPTQQVLVERALLGFKGIEVEVMRDCTGEVVVVGIIEHIDPVQVNGADSIAIISPQSLSDIQIGELTVLSKKVAQAVGVVGELSIRFALDPDSNGAVVLGASPGTTQISGFVEKATGYPISNIAPSLAVGLTLAEITGAKTIEWNKDHLVLRLPRFDFDKFAGADDTLGTSMKSVGEAISFGGNFSEALQKGIRSLEIGRSGLGSDGLDSEMDQLDLASIRPRLAQPNPNRLYYIRLALQKGMSKSEIRDRSGVDEWVIDKIQELIQFESKLADQSLVSVASATLQEAKRLGYSDAQLAYLLETTEDQVRQRRNVLGIRPGYCAAGASQSFYSTYSVENSNCVASDREKVLIIASGPNRIGQGLSYDHSCARAAAEFKRAGWETIVINCNPQAISTEAGVTTGLYLEPLTIEGVLEVINREQPTGVIVQMGGQAALRLAESLNAAGVKIFGTSSDNLNRAQSPALLRDLLKELDLKQTDHAIVKDIEQATESASAIGYPVMVRCAEPFNVKPPEIVYDAEDLCDCCTQISSEYPYVLEKFLEDAVGVDVDIVCDGERAVICGVMERIEQAGVHSGDSAASLPPFSLPDNVTAEIRSQSKALALALGIRGLANVHFAVKDEKAYVLEFIPAASLTIPFVSKATGVKWAEIAANVLMGKSLDEQGIDEREPKHVSVKEAVLPFARFAGVDVVLGPEMKSTGAVMGIDADFGDAYLKAELAAGQNLPQAGTVFISVAGPDKSDIGEVAASLSQLGFNIAATRGTAEAIEKAGVAARIISKIGEGRPDAIDLVKNNEVALIINTPSGKRPRKHEVTIRSAVVAEGIPIITTLSGARATVNGLKVAKDHSPTTVHSIQDYQA
ncbi:MAG: carbamoyl-phosphate synthase large subunit [Armatimonadota bacterium]|jgi:carbamoyl-phosphate synthase large subunit